jgi:predicted nucleic acid-binding protein
MLRPTFWGRNVEGLVCGCQPFPEIFYSRRHKQHEQVVRLFRQAEKGEVRLITGPPVLFEMAWTLRSVHRKARLEILELFEGILSLSWMRLMDREITEEAIQLVREKGSEFADAYILASSRFNGADGVATFNCRDFEEMGAAPYRF